MELVHQVAFLDGQNLVERTRDVESEGGGVFAPPPFGGGWGEAFNFLFRQITLVGCAKVEFVAIFILPDRPHDGLERAEAVGRSGTRVGQGEVADARELVEHLLFLEAQLLFVGQVLPFAAAAHAEMLASRHFAHLAQLVEANGFGLGIAVFFPLDLQIHNVARHAPRHENDQLALGRAVVGGNCQSHQRFSLGGDVGDGYAFKYGKWFLFPRHVQSGFEG